MSGLLAQQTERLNQKYGTTTNIHAGWRPNTATIGTKANSTPVVSNDYLGSVFNSIKNAASAGVGIAGGVANQTWKDIVTSGRGIQQSLPNILLGTNSFQKNGKGGGYVPGLAGLVAPWASPLMQRLQADPNSEGKATWLDKATGSTMGQVGQVSDMIDQTIQNKNLTPAQKQRLLQQQQEMLNNVNNFNVAGQSGTVQPGEFNKAFAATAALPFAFGKFEGIGQAGSALSKAERILGASKEAQPFLPTGVGDIAKTLIKAPFKQELINKPNVESAMALPGQIQQGQYKDAALNAATFAVPAGLMAGKKGVEIAKSFIGKNIFDTSGVFDRVIIKGNKTMNQGLMALKNEANATKDGKILRMAKQTENQMRILQDILLKEAGGNAKLAAQNFERYQSTSNSFKNKDILDALKEGTKHFKARYAAQKLESSGAIPANILKDGNATVARLTQADKKVIADAVEQSDNPLEVVKALRKDKTIKNDTLYGQLVDLANSGENPKLMAERIREISASDPIVALGKSGQFGNGYFVAVNKEAGRLATDVSKTKEIVRGQEARFGKVGELLRKAGISPEEVTAEDNKYVFNKVKDEFIKRIDGVGGKTGNSIYNSLNELADAGMSGLGVTDIRQLSKRAIASKLNITTTDAGKILREAKDSYKILSLEERGLAGKLMDFNLRVNPVAGRYSRIQSVARYEGNPFFRLQENIETRAGLSSMGGKQVLPRTHKYDETITKLNKSGIFSSGYGSEGADTLSNQFSGVKAKLSRDQQANIAATIEKFAGGPDKVDDWLRNPKNADLLNDFKTIVQYPDKGFTSSNLAKMMNLVAFPSRYNIKVTQFAVKQFMKQPAPVQISIIRGLKDFNDFTKTPEGIKWQADNKEALGLLSYFTPIQPITSVYDTLTGKNKSLLDFGMVGGLPFGVITRVLQGQGVLKDRVPYVDPKTGKVYSDRVPEDLKARAESLLNSIVDTLYTYPGRMAGMETSKKQLTQGIVNNATFGKLKDGNYSNVDRSGDITQEQQQQINVLKAGSDQKSSKQVDTPTQFTPIPAGNKFSPAPAPNVAPIYKKKKSKFQRQPSKPISALR